MVLADACNIRRLCELNMREPVELARYTIGGACGFQRVQYGVQRSVADDVNVKSETGQVKTLHEFHDDGAVMLQLTVRNRALSRVKVVFRRELRHGAGGRVLRRVG